MEITDVEQRLAFLDEAQRRERAATERLRAQASAQAAELKAATDALAAVTADLKTAQARLARLENDLHVATVKQDLDGIQRLGQAYTDTHAELEAAMEEWAELA